MSNNNNKQQMQKKKASLRLPRRKGTRRRHNGKMRESKIELQNRYNAALGEYAAAKYNEMYLDCRKLDVVRQPGDVRLSCRVNRVKKELGYSWSTVGSDSYLLVAVTSYSPQPFQYANIASDGTITWVLETAPDYYSSRIAMDGELVKITAGGIRVYPNGVYDKMAGDIFTMSYQLDGNSFTHNNINDLINDDRCERMALRSSTDLFAPLLNTGGQFVYSGDVANYASPNDMEVYQRVGSPSGLNSITIIGIKVASSLSNDISINAEAYAVYQWVETPLSGVSHLGFVAHGTSEDVTKVQRMIAPQQHNKNVIQDGHRKKPTALRKATAFVKDAGELVHTIATTIQQVAPAVVSTVAMLGSLLDQPVEPGAPYHVSLNAEQKILRWIARAKLHEDPDCKDSAEILSIAKHGKHGKLDNQKVINYMLNNVKIIQVAYKSRTRETVKTSTPFCMV